MAASQRETVATIVSSTLKNRGTEMMALAEVCVKQGWDFCAGVMPGSLDVVLPMMAASREETDRTIVSSTLENGGVEKTAPIGVAIQHG